MIELRNITKRYMLGEHEILALNNVSFRVESGEYVAIMGPSGSGKSTLMNIIGCLDVADEGDYILNNKSIDQFEADELAKVRNKELGFVFQQFNLLPRLSALRNVELPLIYSKMSQVDRNKRATELLEMVGLGDRIHHKPKELSGGQQQRVSIARALSTEPTVILADEPTGALDSKSGRDIMAMLEKLNQQGKTIILITHDRDIASHAKRQITINDGEITSDERKETYHA